MVLGLGFRVTMFLVLDLGLQCFEVWGLRLQCFSVWGLRVWGSGLECLGFGVQG